MHDLAFADAARPAGVQILGLWLKPYTIGHEIALLNERNPLVLVNPSFDDVSAEEQFASVSRAVYICCCSWSELTFRPKGRLDLWLHNRQNRIFWKTWNKANQEVDYHAAGLKFQAFRSEAFDFPPAPDSEAASVVDDRLGNGNEPKGRMLGGPWMARLIAYLAQGRIYEAFGYQTPFDIPIRLAEHLHLSYLEDLGRGRIENIDEAEVKAKLDKLRREAAAEQEISTHA